ncbi:hypothetical protein BB558_007608 [Smittium angustum]|uniref:Uncharacterized protein n=1 Tax=Smittium angustum TaxID=133377 RepID=A0A2U1IUN0_SMIAN|nr:hypothetical protein BB558_007587 [Smittium angustum]PVZ96509.1 hypothetical protein BB558_007608 [Smittium angustum]
MDIANFTNKVLDQGILEFIGPFGLTNLFKNTALRAAYYDSDEYLNSIETKQKSESNNVLLGIDNEVIGITFKNLI